MKRLLAALSISALLLAAGCAGTPGEEDPQTPSAAPDPTSSATEPDVAPVVEVIEHLWAQDLWLFNAVRYYTAAGTEVDVTDAIPNHLEKNEPDQKVDLADGVVFEIYDRLAPTVLGADGKVRTDVDVLAGMLTFDDEKVLAVVATPDADAKTPIGEADDLEVDLTFVGDYFKPGMPMSFDFTFMQTYPGDDPATGTPLELLSHRLSTQHVNFYGTAGEDGPDLLMFSNAMGVAVEGSTRMSMSGKGPISAPGLDGFRKGVWSARKGGIGGLRGYFKKFGEGAKGSNDLINCNLGGACGPPVYEPPPPPKCRGFRCGKVHGDPHLVTFDDLAYSPQAVGEFTLVEAPGLTVQMRTEPMGDSRTISVATAVGVKAADQTIMVSTGLPDGAPMLLINGKPTPLPDLPQDVTVGDVVVTASKNDVMIVTNTGEQVSITPGRTQLRLFVDPGKLSELTGMLGNGDADPDNDLVTRDGAAVSNDLIDTEPKAFYSTFVDSWRITQAESLFTYLPGQDTATFTDLTFPDEHIALENIADKELKLARVVCEQAGIMQQPFLNNCLFDYWATGDIDFVVGAKQMDLMTGISSGFYQLDEPAPAGTPVDIPEGHGPEAGQTMADYVAAQWRWSPHSRYTGGDTFAYFCPAGGEPGEPIWGGGSFGYTSDSAVCVAATHQGLITPQTGGLLNVVMIEGLDSYPTQPAANGITPIEWLRPWSYGYVFD